MSRRIPAVLVLAGVLALVVMSQAFAAPGYVSVVDEGFNSLDAKAWSTNFTRSSDIHDENPICWGESYGSAAASAGSLRIRPNWWRGGVRLRSTRTVIDRLPAHVKMRVYFPDGGYRYPYVKLGPVIYFLGQTDHSHSPGAMGMAWTYEGQRHTYTRGEFVSPQNQWLIADVWLTDTNVTGEFNGITTSVEMPVAEMLASSPGGFGFELGVGDDYSTKGAWVDYIVAEQAPADADAPVTVATVSDVEGSGSWFRSDVAVTLTATDAESGVFSTEYSLDGGTSWTAYSAPVTIAAQGTSVLKFRSTDNAGNVENAKSVSVAIDSIAPAVSISAPSGRYIVGQQVTVEWSATDAGSGVDTVEAFARDGSSIDIEPGTFSGTVTATDKAGNTSSASTSWQGAYNVTIARLRGKKAGSALPLKVTITDAGGRAIRHLVPSVQFVRAPSSSFVTAKVPSSKRAVVLRERRAGVYHGVWKTPRVRGTYTLRILIDGLSYDSTVVLR